RAVPPWMAYTTMLFVGNVDPGTGSHPPYVAGITGACTCSAAFAVPGVTRFHTPDWVPPSASMPDHSIDARTPVDEASVPPSVVQPIHGCATTVGSTVMLTTAGSAWRAE